jgi:DNA-binding CsgD family transcriptional regulator
MSELDAAIARLTPRERECLRLAGRMTSKDIARHLGISPHTVDERIGAAVKKLGAANRRAAARLLQDHEGVAALNLGDDSGPPETGGRPPNSSGPQSPQVAPAGAPGLSSASGDDGAASAAALAAGPAGPLARRPLRGKPVSEWTTPERAGAIMVIALATLLGVLMLLFAAQAMISLLQQVTEGPPPSP